MRRFLPVLFCLTLLAGCFGRRQSVHYVVPDGYRGPFWVIHDPTAPELPAVGSGWLQITVPTNGVVLTSSLSPLDAWHESTAVIGNSATGADLEVGKTIVSPGLVGVWIGPSGHVELGREYRSFFVGTEAEFVTCPPSRYQPPRLR